ncbi:hypothetical protein GCM10009550_73320 [Actinocorallia libanotica]|uniref:Uncharacterized protein n=1 Tax=Actinocorallia libanotica TaxID=46162 RepID=A0ABN1RZ05_9ACTN
MSGQSRVTSAAEEYGVAGLMRQAPLLTPQAASAVEAVFGFLAARAGCPGAVYAAGLARSGRFEEGTCGGDRRGGEAAEGRRRRLGCLE